MFCISVVLYFIQLSPIDDLDIQYCAGSKIEKNEIGGARGAYGGGERCAQGSG